MTRLAPGYSQHLRAMSKAFELEHRAETAKAGLLFDQMLVRRPLNPHSTTATEVLSLAISESGIQQNDRPGLRVSGSSLNRGGRKVLLRTPEMAGQGRGLLLYLDGSVLFLSNLAPRQKEPVVVLPTPLALRTSLTREGRKLKLDLLADRSRFNAMKAHLGQKTLVLNGRLAGEEASDAPYGTALTRAWIAQLDAETKALARRLRRLPPYRLAGAVKASPPFTDIFFGHGHFAEARPANVFIHRPALLVDDAHLGRLTYDRDDVALPQLRRALQITVELLRQEPELRAAPEEESVSAWIDAPGPGNDSAILQVMRHGKQDQRLAARALEIIGADALTLASKTFASHLTLTGRNWEPTPVMLTSAETGRQRPSNHALLGMRAELDALRETFRAACS